MSDNTHLVQEKLVDRSAPQDPEYVRLIAAYVDDPLFDLKKIIVPVVEKKEEQQL